MSIRLEDKSTLEEIRTRFDNEVERFSNLETGQQAIIDAPLILELVAKSESKLLAPGSSVLDLGCGAGNFTLRVLKEVPKLNCHLVDLSEQMLARAQQRVRDGGASSVTIQQTDLRNLKFPEHSFDCILAGAVLHHLRDDGDWQAAFALIHKWLKPGGRLYVSDLVHFDIPAIQDLMWARWGDYLETLGGPEYRAKVYDYIDKEDSPRSLAFQLKLLEECGFSHFDVLHRVSVFACYVGVK
jgi:tRNA (cmo5U34)-methyltransferase